MFFLESKKNTRVSLILLCDCIRIYLVIFKLIRGAKLTPSFHSKKGNEVSSDDVPMGSYVSCLYEKEWYDRIYEEVSVEENDVLVKFFHPIDSSVYLQLPGIDFKYWVPVNHVLQLLSIPTVNTSWHPYNFLKSEFKDTQKQFTENL